MKPESTEHLKQIMIGLFAQHGNEGRLTISGVSYTGNELAQAVSNESELGLEMMKMLLALTVDLLIRKVISAHTSEECLQGMLACDKELYEKILDTDGFAYWFNELAKR